MRTLLIIGLSILFALSLLPVHAAAPACDPNTEIGRTLSAPWLLGDAKVPPALTINTSSARVLSVTRETSRIIAQACVSPSPWSITISDGTQSATWTGGTPAAAAPNEAVQRLEPPARRADIRR